MDFDTQTFSILSLGSSVSYMSKLLFVDQRKYTEKKEYPSDLISLSMTILDGSDRYGLLEAEIFNKMPLFALQFTDTQALHQFYSFSDCTQYRVQ